VNARPNADQTLTAGRSLNTLVLDRALTSWAPLPTARSLHGWAPA